MIARILFVALLTTIASLPAQHVWLPPQQTTGDPTSLPPPPTLVDWQLAVADDAIYAVWATDDYAEPVWWSRSLDRGASWTAAAPLFPPTSPSQPLAVKLIAEGSFVLVEWMYFTSPLTVNFAMSHDRGQSWSLQTMSSPPSGCENLMVEGSTVIWSSGAWLFVSTDAGTTWTGPLPIAGAGTNAGPLYDRVLLRLQDGALHAAWSEYVQGTPLVWQAYYNTSTDLGQTWRPVDRPLLGSPQSLGSPLDLITAPGVVMVFWRENNDVYLDRSLDGGMTWLAGPRNVTGVPSGVSPRVAFDGSNLLVAWAVSSGGAYTGSCVRSADLGATWQGLSAPVFTGSAAPLTHWAGMYGGGGLFILAYTYRSCWSLPCTLIHVTAVSADGGATWSGPAGVASARCRFGFYSPPLCADRGALFALWSDYPYMSVPVALSFDWLAGPRPLGGAASGSGGLTPELLMERVPVLGFDSTMELHDGLPGAPAILTFGTRQPPVPFLGGQLLVQPTAHHFAVLGGAGPTAGATSLTFRLPVYGGLSEFGCQAFVLDPGAPFGVAMSDGVEIRMF